MNINKKIVLFCVLLAQFTFSQQIEFGPNIGYGFTNIADSRVAEGRAVIGSALWNINKGFSVIYFFNNPQERITNGIHFEYSISQRGSKSENYPKNEYNFNSKSYNLNYRRATRVSNNIGLYGDIGFGYTILDNNSIYKGNEDELVAFDKLKEPLFIKKNEVTFIFALGLDKMILKNKYVVFFEGYGDAGINKINRNSGAYRTQSLGFSAGIRYLLDIKKHS